MSDTNDKGFFDGNPKMIFAFGLVAGIALMAIFGGGIKIPRLGAEASGNDDDVLREFDTEDTTDEEDQAVLAPVTAADHIRGDIENAKVVMIEYSDFECPYCSLHQPVIQALYDEYGDDIAWVYRHYPLTSLHAEAYSSALASECAAEQGDFWAYADELYERQDEFGDELYESMAEDHGLDVDQFMDCYENEKYASEVSDDAASGYDAGVQGTPATFVNGILVAGAQPFDNFAEIIDSYLSE